MTLDELEAHKAKNERLYLSKSPYVGRFDTWEIQGNQVYGEATLLNGVKYGGYSSPDSCHPTKESAAASHVAKVLTHEQLAVMIGPNYTPAQAVDMGESIMRIIAHRMQDKYMGMQHYLTEVANDDTEGAGGPKA